MLSSRRAHQVLHLAGANGQGTHPMPP